MWMDLLVITLIGLAAGVIGTTAGGLSVVLIKTISNRLLSILLGFSAGVMVAITFEELIPHAVEDYNIWTATLGILLGIGIIGILDINFPHRHFSMSIDGDKERAKQLKTGVLLSAGIAMHNLPEGVAIGVTFLVSFEAGIGIAILMAIHNFPEGMAVGASMCVGGVKGSKVALTTILAGVPMGIGAFIGGGLEDVSDFTKSIAFGFAAGAMLYIVFDELIPDAHRKMKGHYAIMGILSGIILGIIFIDLLH